MVQNAKKTVSKRPTTKRASAASPTGKDPVVDPEPVDLKADAEPADLGADAEVSYSKEHLNSEPDEASDEGVEEAADSSEAAASFASDARQTAVNSQIADAVRQTAAAVIGGQSRVLDATTKTAMTQSLAMAVQDATEHLRRTQILAESATALGMKRVAEGRENGQDTINAAAASVMAATKALAEVGDTVAKMRKDLDIA